MLFTFSLIVRTILTERIKILFILFASFILAYSTQWAMLKRNTKLEGKTR